MIIARLNGGMGNQMFQYALGRALSLKYDVPLKLDTSYLLDRTYVPNFTYRDYNLEPFCLKAAIATQQEIPFLYRRHFSGMLMRYLDALRRKIVPTPGKEKGYHFDSSILAKGTSLYLEGWWQSYKYFEDYADEIRKDFQLKNPSQKAKDLIAEISSKNSVCIHIRRGDYVGNSLHPVVDKAYYDRALQIISEKREIDCLYVFDRDDIQWCKDNLAFDYPVVFVENDISVAETTVVMSSCKHFVMANSSLSWWAAWLGNSPQKMVIAPQQWFADKTMDTKDLIPETWIRI